MGYGIWIGDRYIPDMDTLRGFAGPGACRGGSSDSGPSWITTLVMLAPVALKLMSRGSLVIPKKFERSDLALEYELNAAILEITKEDFLLDNCDLQSLFSESLNRYYSDEVVLWLGTELTNGKQAAFQRLADGLEPVHTVLEMGLGCVDVFRVVSSFQDSQGDLISEWEAVLGGPYSTGSAIHWRTVRVWKQRVVIAERIEGLASVGHKGT